MAGKRESLLDVLQRSGGKVLWHDKSPGAMWFVTVSPGGGRRAHTRCGVCSAEDVPRRKAAGCLDKQIEQADSDTVIRVAHEGQTWPAYYKRYPPASEHFNPAFGDVQLDRCNAKALTTRVTTPYVTPITFFGQNHRTAAVACVKHLRPAGYCPAAGSRLARKAGTCTACAVQLLPEEQGRIPFMFWVAADSAAAWNIGIRCARTKAAQPISPDNLYPMVRGLRLGNGPLRALPGCVRNLP